MTTFVLFDLCGDSLDIFQTIMVLAGKNLTFRDSRMKIAEKIVSVGDAASQSDTLIDD